ncbi:DUF2185 domain-containing protein [Reinekea thalattae]|uniref:DUF2185 domain-containing protein n=1 Tax=Reinekea thalattae TaxID=2593301 RepID=A0A5C8Z756_9GAMM|nr:DUF2185 domain-containing protein [Reinekea thalattae]TXR53925.1 DUF2185 domain-containing protein [Reinekea thalattae]
MMNEVCINNKAGHLCLASSLILNERPLPIRFFYKELPQHKNDTGFRFYSGQETDEFLQEEDAACVAPLDCMERLDPSISELVKQSEVGSVWERLPDSNHWVPVHDYVIPD